MPPFYSAPFPLSARAPLPPWRAQRGPSTNILSEMPSREGLLLVASAMEAQVDATCVNIGRIARRLLQAEGGTRGHAVVCAYMRQALQDDSLHTPTQDAAVREWIRLLGIGMSGYDESSLYERRENLGPENCNDDHHHTSAKHFNPASRHVELGIDPTKCPPFAYALDENQCALIWVLLARTQDHLKNTPHIAFFPPFTITPTSFETNANRGTRTTYTAYHVPLPRHLVTSTIDPLYLDIAKASSERKWIEAHECSFEHTLRPLWRRRMQIGLTEDFVDDGWDGSAWQWASRQQTMATVSPFLEHLWNRMESWLCPTVCQWNYATLEDFPASFDGYATECEYTRSASVPDAQSLVVKVNISQTPLEMTLRWYRSSPPQTHTYVIHQGDALVLPQAMLSFVEFGIRDPAIHTPTNPAMAVTERGAMVLTLMAMRTSTMHSPTSVKRALTEASSPEAATERTTGGTVAVPSTHDAEYVGFRPPTASLTKAMHTLVDAAPTVVRVQGRRGRPRILTLPAKHQLVAVRGRRFDGNPTQKHWFAVVQGVDETTGVTRVNYLEETSYDDITDPRELVFPLHRSTMNALHRYTKTDPEYQAVWEQAMAIVSRAEKPGTTIAPAGDMQTRIEAPSMQPVYATCTQWCIKTQTDEMGYGLYVTKCEERTLFPYSCHPSDLDHLQAANTSGAYAIVMQSAPTTTHNVLNMANPDERGPGAYANAVDYRIAPETHELEYIPSEENRTHQPNARLMEYAGKVYVQATRGLREEYVMVCYGDTYANE